MSEATSDDPQAAPAVDSPEVRAMAAALERGDHGEARALAAQMSASDDAAERAAAETMLARFRRDPWVDGVFVGTTLLMAFLAVYYLGRHG